MNSLIIFIFTFIYPYIDTRYYSSSKNNLSYKNYFFLSNNITGTDNPEELDEYRNRCSQKLHKCSCCIGNIDDMRCGLPVICLALSEADIQRRKWTAGQIAYTIIIIYAAGFKTLGLAFRLRRENDCCKVFYYILLPIGLIGTFPFSIFFIYLLCDSKNKNHEITNIKAKKAHVEYNIDYNNNMNKNDSVYQFKNR